MLILATILGFVLCFYLTYKWPVLALVLAPVLSVLVFFLAVVQEDMVAACLAPGIFLTTNTLMAFCMKDRDNYHRVACVARWLLFVPLLVGLMVTIGVVFNPWALVLVFVVGVWMASMISYGATSRWSKSVCLPGLRSVAARCGSHDYPALTVKHFSHRMPPAPPVETARCR